MPSWLNSAAAAPRCSSPCVALAATCASVFFLWRRTQGRQNTDGPHARRGKGDRFASDLHFALSLEGLYFISRVSFQFKRGKGCTSLQGLHFNSRGGRVALHLKGCTSLQGLHFHARGPREVLDRPPPLRAADPAPGRRGIKASRSTPGAGCEFGTGCRCEVHSKNFEKIFCDPPESCLLSPKS